MPKRSIPDKHFFIFAGAFLLLNFVVFATDYVVYFDTTTFWPSSRLSESGSFGPLRRLFLRDNYDIFRIAAELLIPTIGLLLFRKAKPVWQRVVTGLILMVFVLLTFYHIYFAVSVKLYGFHPNLINDLSLAAEVLPVYLGQVFEGGNLQYLLLVLAMAVFLVLAFLLVRLMARSIRNMQPVWPAWVMVGVLSVLTAVSTWNYRQADYDDFVPGYTTFQWTWPRFAKSIRMGMENPMDKLTDPKVYRDYQQLKLRQKPDIYLIFVESYGKAVFKDQKTREPYRQKLFEVEDRLKKGNWQMATTYSESPIIGGRSWLGFTSLMGGLKVPDQLQFNALLNIHYDYPHLVRFLAAQNYETFRLKTMANVENSTPRNYALADRFYGFDHWIKFSDIPYRGFHSYNWYGSIPDQYAINFFADEIPKDSLRPFFLFMITMVSHMPFHPPPPVLDDWRALDTIQTNPTPKDDPLEGPFMPRLLTTLEYEIEMLTRFILEKGDDDDIFILVGDHQPPWIDPAIHGFAETAMHIIARDSAFVASFLDYDFEPGMYKSPEAAGNIYHEGFYSLFMRELMARYGEPGQKLPEYMPRGITGERWDQPQ